MLILIVFKMIRLRLWSTTTLWRLSDTFFFNKTTEQNIQQRYSLKEVTNRKKHIVCII
jgi:hypothetical protein